MIKFKIDRRKKKEIELKGNCINLPFDYLEEYTEEKIENLGSIYRNKICVINENNLYTHIYKINEKYYICDTINHFNTEMISAILIELKEVA